jgi:hypothetical protein
MSTTTTATHKNGNGDDDDGDSLPSNATASVADMTALVQRAVDKATTRTHKALEVVRTARSLDDLSLLRPLVQVC